MSVVYSTTLQDSSGNAQTGKTVKLYNFGDTPGVDPAVGTLVDNGDGTYQIDVSNTGKYLITVDGTIQDETNGILIVADDVVSDISGKADKVSGANNGNLAGLDASGNLTDSGKAVSDLVQKTDVIDNLTSTDTDKPLSANQGKTLKDTQDTMKGAGWTSETLKGLKDLIGDMDLSSGIYIGDASSVTAALLMLNNEIMNKNAGEVAGQKIILSYSLDGVSGAESWLDAANISQADQGFPILRNASITGIGVSWTAGSISGSDFKDIILWDNGYDAGAGISISASDVSEKCKIKSYEVGEIPISAGHRLACKHTRFGGTETLTDMIVTVELTLV